MIHDCRNEFPDEKGIDTSYLPGIPSTRTSVEMSSPMRRGLTHASVHRYWRTHFVEMSSPMRRGLTQDTEPHPMDAMEEVEMSSPMRRGLTLKIWLGRALALQG